jgi:hypothetical protein
MRVGPGSCLDRASVQRGGRVTVRVYCMQLCSVLGGAERRMRKEESRSGTECMVVRELGGGMVWGRVGRRGRRQDGMGRRVWW